MKITIEIPDTMLCGFLNYVYVGNEGIMLGSKQIDTDDIRSGESIVCDTVKKAEKGQDGNEQEL